jgi:hypothetical protein
MLSFFPKTVAFYDNLCFWWEEKLELMVYIPLLYLSSNSVKKYSLHLNFLYVTPFQAWYAG